MEIQIRMRVIRTFLSGMLCSFALLVFSIPTQALAYEPGDEQIKLYPGKVPGEPSLKEGEKIKDTRYHRGFHFDIHEPLIDVYHAKGESRTKVAVVVCPGGGYGAVATGIEGMPAVKWLQKNGITVVLLRSA